MAILFTDNAETTLAAGISAAATTISLTSGTAFPALTGTDGNHFILTLEDSGGNREFVKVIHRSGSSLGDGTYPCVRGYGGSTAQAWDAGDSASLRWSAQALSDKDDDNDATFVAKAGSTMTGDLVMSGATVEFAKGADVASASTIDLDAATGNYVVVTGTTGITAITLSAGRARIVRFSGALTLTHSSTLRLPGAANITTAANDVAVFVGDASSVVRCASYISAAGNVTAEGTAALNDQVVLGGVISPSQITADQNDYSPTDFQTSTVLRINSDATRTLTGLVAPTGSVGAIKILHNIGTERIILSDNNAASSAANRFQFDTDVVLAATTSVLLYYDTSSTRWKIVGDGRGQASMSDLSSRVFSAPGMHGGEITASVASSALTIAVKTDESASDPSAAEPVVFVFRSATLGATTGYVRLRLEAALSITINSTAMLGAISGQALRVWVVAFNDSNTLRLGVINCLSRATGANFDIYPLSAAGVADSTLESNTSDNPHVFYTDAAGVSAKAYCVLGYLEWDEMVAAGTWTAPDRIVMFGGQVPLPGAVVQSVASFDSAVATGTTLIPQDNTIPQNTEGDQYMSKAITVRSSANVLEIEHIGNYSNSAGNNLTAALFQDATAAAIAAAAVDESNATNMAQIVVRHRMLSDLAEGTSTTFNVRAGGSVAATHTFNGNSGTRLYGGVMASRLDIREIMA